MNYIFIINTYVFVMNSLPKELEDIIMDYKDDLENTENNFFASVDDDYKNSLSNEELKETAIILTYCVRELYKDEYEEMNTKPIFYKSGKRKGLKKQIILTRCELDGTRVNMGYYTCNRIITKYGDYFKYQHSYYDYILRKHKVICCEYFKEITL